MTLYVYFDDWTLEITKKRLFYDSKKAVRDKWWWCQKIRVSCLSRFNISASATKIRLFTCTSHKILCMYECVLKRVSEGERERVTKTEWVRGSTRERKQKPLHVYSNLFHVMSCVCGKGKSEERNVFSHSWSDQSHHTHVSRQHLQSNSAFSLYLSLFPQFAFYLKHNFFHLDGWCYYTYGGRKKNMYEKMFYENACFTQRS